MWNTCPNAHNLPGAGQGGGGDSSTHPPTQTQHHTRRAAGPHGAQYLVPAQRHPVGPATPPPPATHPHFCRCHAPPRPTPMDHPPTKLCEVPLGCGFFTGPWTVTRSSLRMLRRVNAFDRCTRCFLRCRFSASGAQQLGNWGLCWLSWGRLTIFAAHSPPRSGRPPHASPHHNCQKRHFTTRRAPTPCTTLYDASYSVVCTTLYDDVQQRCKVSYDACTTYIYIYIYMCVCVCVCVYTHIYVCVCVCMYTHTYTHTYTHAEGPLPSMTVR